MSVINGKQEPILIKLKGALADVFLPEMRLVCDSVASAIAGIKANFPHFEKYMFDAAKAGIKFNIKVGYQDVDEHDCNKKINPKVKVITISPVLAGSGGLLKAIAGVALIGMAIAGVSFLGFGGIQMGIIGASLLFNGIGQMFGKNKDPKDEEQKTSRLFDRPLTQVEEGARIPIVCGTHRLGTLVISQRIRSSYYAI